MLKYKYLLLSAGVLVFLLSCCRDDDSCSDPTNPKCSNYDPCYYSEIPTAYFTIKDVIVSAPDYNSYSSQISDTSRGGLLEFAASPNSNNSIKHTWYLGSEVIHDSSFIRDFSDVDYRPVTITVSHVIEYDVDPTCYPYASGKDSTSRTFVLARYFNDLPIFGTYRVADNETPNDSFDVTIRVYGVTNSGLVTDTVPITNGDQYMEDISYHRIEVVNLERGNRVIRNSTQCGFNFAYSNIIGRPISKCVFRLSGRNRISILYYEQFEEEYHTLIGKRLHL